MSSISETPTEADHPATQLEVGQTVTFSKTVSEADVYLFAGISGDLGPNHVNEEYMKKTPYGGRIAHGVLLIAYMSTCSTKLIESIGNPPMVSYGYDRIRFIRPVFLGDTVTVHYTVAEHDDRRDTVRSNVEVTNQNGEVVAAATHILKAV